MFGLLIKILPIHDESLIGYLHRLGSANALWGGEVVKIFKELSDEKVYEWLGKDTRPASWDDVVSIIRFPNYSNQKVWSLVNFKFCPICLAAKFYWRELWDMPLYTVCSVHKIELVYRCQKCKEKINQSTLITGNCGSCGVSVLDRDISNTVANESNIWISGQLENRLMHGRSNRLSGIDALTYQQFHFLAVRIGVRALSLKYPINLTLASMSPRAVAPDLAKEASRILLGWPRTFHDLLSDIIKKRRSKLTFKLGSAFGLIYRDVYLSLTDRCYDFIRSEFELFIVQNWEGPLAMRNRRLSECTLLEHRWLPYKTAAQKTGLPIKLLKKLHLSGELDTREFRYSCGKTTTVIDIEEAHRLSLIVLEPLNLRETSRLLCLTRKRIEQLIKSEVIKVVGGSRHVGEKWMVDYSSIVALAPKSFLLFSNDDFITVSQVAKYYLPTSSGLAELIMAIQAGEIPVFCRAPEDTLNVGKWLVSPKELVHKKITCNASLQAKGMSVAEAAKMLGVKEEVAYALVRLGRLRSETVQCSRRPAQVVSLGAVQHFKRNYILAPEVALNLKISVVNVLDLLQGRCFFPVVGPNISHALCRQYVWRRSKQLKIYLAQEQNFTGKKRN